MLKFFIGFVLGIAFLIVFGYFNNILCFHDAMNEKDMLKDTKHGITITIAHNPTLKTEWKFTKGSQGSGYLGGNRVIIIIKDEKIYNSVFNKFKNLWISNNLFD